ncbi:SDR family oxidoreductase [Phenylobacterium deserti]|uniref:Short-chain dehydrogenase n=1 Tax=Phenylobacterium deserti TaxID=1914756 RepID=A0A328AWT6_9CAUL|nr:SDR family oxidoreductase [Phenylobacterium deserti]RAK58166.1 short-chain dehydrogenase [Phenylobacterium deserti]
MRPKLKPLAQQVLVITGASSGIGLATARKAGRAGAAVVLTARNEAALREAADEINRFGGRAHTVVADVGDPEAVARIGRAALARFGRIDTWVNVAGVGIYGPLKDVTPEDHERLFRTNYFGVVNGTLEALRHLQSRPEGGAIINVGSVLSDAGAPLMGAYSASKHAVKGFTESLRMEIAREKLPVSVTLIKPSSISTPFPEHTKNLTESAMRPPPPLYSPDVVADAILHAAEHPVRQLNVGFGARDLPVVAASAPRLADSLFGRLIPPLTRLGGIRSSGDTLYAPGRDGRIEAAAYKGRRYSVYTEAQKHKLLVVGVGALAVAGAAIWLGRGRIGRTTRPLAARALRPLVIKAIGARPLAVAKAAAKRPRWALRLAAALR